MFTFNLFQSRTECLVGKNVLIRKVLSLMYVAEFRLDNSDSFISIIIHPWLVITIRNESWCRSSCTWVKTGRFKQLSDLVILLPRNGA
jgi:hypothetical protein